jgi:hypothetical protein
MLSNNVAVNFQPIPLEPFIEAEEAALILYLSPRHMKKLARAGKIPAHPRGEGQRRRWLFLPSELHAWVLDKVNSPCGSCSEGIQ